MEKAKIVLLLGPTLARSVVSVNDRILPYSTIEIRMDADKTIIKLSRSVGDDMRITEELCKHPIIEEYVADPLVFATYSGSFGAINTIIGGGTRPQLTKGD